MKKAFIIITLLCGNIVTSAANVYFDVGSPGDVYDGKTYYSTFITGSAPMSYHIATVGGYWVVSTYQCRIKYPDGSWTAWIPGQSGGWALTIEGHYQIQARIWVDYDFAGQNNYWMYSNILDFYVVDNENPPYPQNFTADFSGSNPVLSWSAISQADKDSYIIAKKVEGVTGYADVATVSATTTQWTDYSVEHAGKFDPLYVIKYKIKSQDVNDNTSGYSSEQSVTATTDEFWKLVKLDDALNIPEYKLEQNYPNPFNPTTNINFEIPENSHISLVIYNILGEKIATLINSPLVVGVYSITFNAGEFPSGIYVYELRSQRTRISKKMILTK